MGRGAVNELASKPKAEYAATKVALVTDPGVAGGSALDTGKGAAPLTTMRPLITATAAFDAMAHADEPVTSTIGQGKLRNRIPGAHVAQAVSERLPIAMAGPDGLEAREELGLGHVGLRFIRQPHNDVFGA